MIPRTVQLTENGWVVEAEGPKSPAATTVGARILAAVAMGKYSSKEAALKDVTGKRETKGKLWDALVTDGHLVKRDGFWVVVPQDTSSAA